MSRNTCGISGNVWEQFNQSPPAFNGEPIRIQIYITQAVLNLPGTSFWTPGGTAQSIIMLGGAGAIFRQHTLDLNIRPLNTYNPIIPYDSPIYVGQDDAKDKELCKQLLNSVDHKKLDSEKRLIVIFALIDSALTYGICMLFEEWLPFVIVDPRATDPDVVLAHEIGHACRCAHVKDSVMESCLTEKQASKKFHNIHAYELYKSYWCTGPRPKNWFVTQANFHINNGYTYRGPYLWEPYNNPTDY